MRTEAFTKAPPTSTRTSNPQSDRLDFDNDDGGNDAASQFLEFSDASDLDSDGELEEGEIASEVETVDDDSRPASEVKCQTDSARSKKLHIPNFNIVKYKQSYEYGSAASSNTSTDQIKAESSDIAAEESFDKSDVESSDGEIYSASEDNQISDEKEQAMDLFDMVFDIKSEKEENTADSVNDTLTEDMSDGVGRKRKYSATNNEEKNHTGEESSTTKKFKASCQAAVEDPSSDAGTTNENGLTHEFDVIDETNEEGGDNYDQDGGEYDSDDEEDDDLDDNEIYAWLEEGVSKNSAKPDGDEEPSRREKLVLQGIIAHKIKQTAELSVLF